MATPLRKSLKLKELSAVTSTEFKALLNATLNKIPTKKDQLLASRVAVAVSGGPDSLSMAALAAETLGKQNIIAYIVDHGLKSLGVSENSEKVASMLAQQGIQSDIIRVQWPEESELVASDSEDSNQAFIRQGKMQLRAREERYQVLLDACKKHGTPLVLLGHTLEDDIITMFYRMSRLSGIDGMAAMKSVSTFPLLAPASDSFFMARPLLTVSKSRLIETCKSRQLDFIEDSSNDCLNYRRNEMLDALCRLQDNNENISTESLQRALNNIKGHRAYLHNQLSSLFSKSVMVNKTVGESTLILNNPELFKSRFLFNRVITALVQFATAKLYPPKTSTLNRVFDEMKARYDEYEKEQLSKRNMLYSRHSVTLNDDFNTKTRRIDMNQQTLGGATIYPLSRNDTVRRLQNHQMRFQKKLNYGPGLLIERESPSRPFKGAIRIETNFTDNKTVLWDDRLFISLDSGPNNSMFVIEPMKADDVKKFEDVTKNNRSLRKPLYQYLNLIPLSHVHIIPVVREIGSDYMAFPTLNVSSNPEKFVWKTFNAASGLIAGKFICLP